MAITRDIYVVLECENCGEIFCSLDSTAKETRKEAKIQGWVYQEGTLGLPSLYHNKGDFCKRCIDEVNEKKINGNQHRKNKKT